MATTDGTNEDPLDAFHTDYETATSQTLEGQPKVVDMPQPDLSDSKFGLLSKYYQIHKAWKKRRKLGKKGYVRWMLIDETYPEPKFVKPAAEGGKVPEIRHDGQPYFFPRAGALPDSRTGMYTYVHKQGDADPINLRDPSKHTIETDALEEWLQLQLHKDPPSWWDHLDIDGKDIFLLCLGLVVVLAVVYPMIAGG